MVCAEIGRIAATKNNAIETVQMAVNFILLVALLKVVPPPIPRSSATPSSYPLRSKEN